MRIVTRPDFDGVVCAVFLREIFGKDLPILWVEPFEVQAGEVETIEGDIIANLPWSKNCSWWFDHHITNVAQAPYQGDFRIAPSAAGVIFDFFKEKLIRFEQLSKETDKIDSADFTAEEIACPENSPYAIISMTINGGDQTENEYLLHLIKLLETKTIEEVAADPEVSQRCAKEIKINREFMAHLAKHTTLHGTVALTDFRTFVTPPNGNRFLIYSLFPEANVSIRLRYKGPRENGKLVASVGHSILNRTCHVNVGELMQQIGGGGHAAAGSCSFHESESDVVMEKLLRVLNEK